ncbi:AraC family transcriptional regulator [Actinotalea sp. K2]|uniref:AraC family transcriptional regulator n=1 Tax=Actinotalea sp. K2 TaxID=2939438 RepID=UPI002017F036|nr:AraC family transcriptional regulator [Actinotalea sp. K2]MCL3859716.1 AraC family transcriptional regulator [Actinotalea sp. K2]
MTRSLPSLPVRPHPSPAARLFPAPRVDPVGEALHLLRLDGALYCRSELTAPSGIDLPPFDDLLFLHVVTSGRAWLTVGGQPPRALDQGSVALVAPGVAHRLTSGPSQRATPLFDIPVETLSERYEVLRHGGGGETTLATCSVLRLDHAASARILAELPPALVVDVWSGDDLGWVHSTMRLIAREAAADRPGGETVLTRLADVLAVQVLRAWLDEGASSTQGWLAALHDEHVGAALAAVHRAPAHPWTLDGLAAVAHLSRSAFAARFTALVGEPAMRYVTWWRLRLAHDRLVAGDLSVASVAHGVGYVSEAAFSRAFRRELGVAPGEVRRRRPAPLPRSPEVVRDPAVVP